MKIRASLLSPWNNTWKEIMKTTLEEALKHETVEFDIKGQIIDEVQHKKIFGDKDEDYAQEHVEEILYIVSIFGCPNVSQYKLMTKVFSI